MVEAVCLPLLSEGHPLSAIGNWLQFRRSELDSVHPVGRQLYDPNLREKSTITLVVRQALKPPDAN